MLLVNTYYRDPNHSGGNAADMTSRGCFSIFQQLNGTKDESVKRIAGKLLGLMFQEPYNALVEMQKEMNAYGDTHKESDKSAEVRVLRMMAKIIGDQLHRAESSQTGIYLGTVANKTEQDAAIFRMYLDIADKMGIQLGDDAINQLIRSRNVRRFVGKGFQGS